MTDLTETDLTGLLLLTALRAALRHAHASRIGEAADGPDESTIEMWDIPALYDDDGKLVRGRRPVFLLRRPAHYGHLEVIYPLSTPTYTKQPPPISAAYLPQAHTGSRANRPRSGSQQCQAERAT